MLAIDPNVHARLGSLPKTPEASLEAAAQGFETVFLEQVMGAMRQATAGLGEHQLQDGQQTLMMRQLLDAELAKHAATHQGVGLAETLVAQLTGSASSPVNVEGTPL